MKIEFLADRRFQGYTMEWPLAAIPRAGENLFVWDGEDEWDLRLENLLWDPMNDQITIWFGLDSRLTDEERDSLTRGFRALDEKLNGPKE